MDYDKSLARIYEHLEEDQVEKAVMGCLRVARNAKDYLNAAIFMRELYPDRHEVGRVLYDDTAHLKEEAQKFIWTTSLEHWIKAHTLDFSLSSDEDGEEKNVLKVAVGEIDPELAQWELSIADMTLPSGLDPFDAASFLDRFTQEKGRMRLRIKALQTIKTRLKARCLNYAIQIERQIQSQRQSQGFLETVQNDVNNFFKARSEDVFRKLLKAAQLSATTELEDASLLLTEVRRALKAVADHFYPPVTGVVICSDGKERTLGEDQYMNRLQEFLATRVDASASDHLLRAELDHLASYIRRLNDVASKGVHASATIAEARQGLVGLYFFLFNVSQHLTRKPNIVAPANLSTN